MNWLPIIGVAVAAVVCLGTGLLFALRFFDTPSTDRLGESGEQPADLRPGYQAREQSEPRATEQILQPVARTST